MRLLPDGFDAVDELYSVDYFGQLVVSVEAALFFLDRLGELEDHGKRDPVGEAAFRAHGPVLQVQPETSLNYAEQRFSYLCKDVEDWDRFRRGLRMAGTPD